VTALGVLALAAAVTGLVALGWRVSRPATSPAWHTPAPDRGSAATSRDGRLWALERVVTGHLTSREPSSALALQLRELADRRLALRHGVHWDTDRARTVELLGPEVVDLVEARPPRRMSLDQIDAVLRRIEDV
jgi:hypothetical protein